MYEVGKDEFRSKSVRSYVRHIWVQTETLPKDRTSSSPSKVLQVLIHVTLVLIQEAHGSMQRLLSLESLLPVSVGRPVSGAFDQATVISLLCKRSLRSEESVQ